MKSRIKIISILIVTCLISGQLTFAREDSSDLTTTARVKLQAVLTPPYVIGPGDQLSITDRTLREDFGLVEKYDVVVSADGYISIPLPDGKQESLLAAGYTLDELSTEVRDLFGRTLKNPLVYVQISKYRPINVYIGGQVVKPGVYKVESTSTQEEGGTTSTNSLNTFGLSLAQSLQLAGGLKPLADITNITVTRGANSEKKVINLKELITGTITYDDINIQPGDAIFVSDTADIEKQAQTYVRLLGKLAYQEMPVSVVGEVKSAGSFDLDNDATLLDAIGKAGGLNEFGTYKKIRLSRYDENGVYMTYYLNAHDLIHDGTAFGEIALRPHDVVEMIPSKGKLVRNYFKDVSKQALTYSIQSAALSAGQFVVQDNLFQRQAQLQRSLRFPLGGLGGLGGITLINGERKANDSLK